MCEGNAGIYIKLATCLICVLKSFYYTCRRGMESAGSFLYSILSTLYTESQKQKRMRCTSRTRLLSKLIKLYKTSHVAPK